MNRVYNLAATLSGDSQFGARVGQTFRLEDFGPFVEYALHGQTLGEFITRSIAAQPLHSGDTFENLRGTQHLHQSALRMALDRRFRVGTIAKPPARLASDQSNLSCSSGPRHHFRVRARLR